MRLAQGHGCQRSKGTRAKRLPVRVAVRVCVQQTDASRSSCATQGTVASRRAEHSLLAAAAFFWFASACATARRKLREAVRQQWRRPGHASSHTAWACALASCARAPSPAAHVSFIHSSFIQWRNQRHGNRQRQRTATGIVRSAGTQQPTRAARLRR